MFSPIFLKTYTKLLLVLSLSYTLHACGTASKPEYRSERRLPAQLNETTTIMIDLQSIANINSIKGYPLNGYHLSLENLTNNESCSPKSNVDETNEWFRGKIVRVINSNCDWIIRLQLGTITTSSQTLRHIYFDSKVTASNQSGDISVLKELLGKKSLKINLRLRLTQDGWKFGYGQALSGGAGSVWPKPEDGTNPDNDDWINIDVDVQPSTPAIPNPENHYPLKLYKAERKRGVEFPTYWMHNSHPLKVKKSDNIEENEFDYTDIWLAKELNKIFYILYKAPFNIRQITHLGIYNYRKINGSSQLSRHSFATAIDISSFTLSNGKKITIENDWQSGPYSNLLHNIRDEFCRFFDVVLSPDYNQDHHNHFHVDLDPGRRSEREEAYPSWQDLPSKPTDLLSLFSLQPGLMEQSQQTTHNFGHGYIEENYSLHSSSNDQRTCR